MVGWVQQQNWLVGNKETSIGGWGVRSTDPEPGNRFVSCVRASGRGEAVCACEAMLLPRLGFGRSQRAQAFPRALPKPCLGSAARCFLVLISAYQNSVMLFNAS